MFQVIGIKTEEMYFEGESKAEAVRWINQLETANANGHKTGGSLNIPEPLRILPKPEEE
ncbi:hypothetical protein [Periweissella cryptocerci]|uniref:hypothetical protein n=1 Tax=Periweissella cryptocerci TaxID=2506420 RepID=UPI001404298E|nr:hypothetical protein [Periweissella cryptocerci]